MLRCPRKSSQVLQSPAFSEQEPFAYLACLPPHSKAGSHKHLHRATPCRGSRLLSSHPLLHLQHPSLALCSDYPSSPFSFFLNPSLHVPCWHVACCVCQLVNARCTAADKDQKDITNNRLLTGERDTQVPPRESPPQLTPFSQRHPAYPLLFIYLLPTTLSSPVTPEQGFCAAWPQIIICSWIMSQQKPHKAIGVSESVRIRQDWKCVALMTTSYSSCRCIELFKRMVHNLGNWKYANSIPVKIWI